MIDMEIQNLIKQEIKEHKDSCDTNLILRFNNLNDKLEGIETMLKDMKNVENDRINKYNEYNIDLVRLKEKVETIEKQMKDKKEDNKSVFTYIISILALILTLVFGVLNKSESSELNTGLETKIFTNE